jgi:hypothetical protein
LISSEEMKRKSRYAIENEFERWYMVGEAVSSNRATM